MTALPFEILAPPPLPCLADTRIEMEPSSPVLVWWGLGKDLALDSLLKDATGKSAHLHAKESLNNMRGLLLAESSLSFNSTT